MAKKKTLEPVKPIEPESNSSDYETDASSGEEEEPPTTTLKPDSSESDSDPEPIPNPSTTITISKRPAASEATKSVNAKKQKSNSDSSKKVLFQRLFSEEDEIVILNGMIEFETKEKSPVSDIDAFFKFIKNKLHVDVSKKQLQRKIMKLRKRYENNREKAMSSVKPFYDRADKLWGNGGGGGGGGGEEEKVKEAGVSSVTEAKNCVVGKDMGSYFGLSSDEKLIRMGVELFGGDEKIAGWEEWNKLEKEEMELAVKQLDVKRAKMSLVLDTME